MIRRQINVGIVCAFVAMAATACRNDPAALSLKELQRIRSGPLDIVLLSPSGALTQGKGSFVLEFRRADGILVDAGTVKVNATMPMAGMAPMFGAVDIQRTDTPGRYDAVTDLGMAGGWQIGLEWEGPSGRGTARFQQTVR